MKYCKNIFVIFLFFPAINLAEEVVFPKSTQMAIVELEMDRRGIEHERPAIPQLKKIEEEVPLPEPISPSEAVVELVEEEVSEIDTERTEFKKDLDSFYELIVEKTADEKKIDDNYRYLRSKWKNNTYYIRAIDQAYTTYLLIEVTKG